jgi:hypothetical protein
LSTIDNSWFSSFIVGASFYSFLNSFVVFGSRWIVVKHVIATNCCLNNNILIIKHSQ